MNHNDALYNTTSVTVNTEYTVHSVLPLKLVYNWHEYDYV